MLKNALVYRIEHWDPPSPAEIERRLSDTPFVECGATQPESSGWVAPRGEQHGALAETVGGQLLLKLCSETRAVPGAVVKTQLQAQLDTIERQTGRRPRGKQLKELKEAVTHALLPRAFPRRTETLVWLDAEARLVWIGAGSAKRADAIVTRLADALGGGLRLSLMQTALSPATAMSAWLSEKEAPPGFSIDRECVLRQPDSEKSSVRYARHTLDIDEIGEHIRQGKLPTQLALTWAGRVSFVLTEALTLKKIELLDGVLDGPGSGAAGAGRADDDFDADVAIATGELRQLLPALIEALGGLHERQAEPQAAPAGQAGPTEPAPWEAAPA